MPCDIHDNIGNIVYFIDDNDSIDDNDDLDDLDDLDTSRPIVIMSSDWSVPISPSSLHALN